MTKVERFEDLNCWKKARTLTNSIYSLSSQTAFARDHQLRNQIQGASGSIMHNIAEGFDAGSDLEFIRFLKMARRSASEVQSELYLALDRKYIIQDDLKCTYDLSTEVKRLINGLIAYLRQTAPDQKRINEDDLFDYSTNGYQTKD